MHARIADIVEDPLLRARHLALSQDAPDAEVADVLDDAARARGRSRCIGRRGRARRAGAPADAAGRARRASSPSAGRSSCASGCRGVDTRPHDRDRPAGRDGDRLRCAPRPSCSSPSSRASTGCRRCSRRHCARRPRARRSSRSSRCRLAWAMRFRNGFARRARARACGARARRGARRRRASRSRALMQLAWPRLRSWATRGASTRSASARLAVAVGGEQLVREATIAVADYSSPSPRIETPAP